jgi:prevent-host-death family protein
MKDSIKRTEPEFVVKGGKPVAVIIDINDYQEMLERLEDAEDLKMLQEMRQKKLRFRTLEEFLEEHEKDL